MSSVTIGPVKKWLNVEWADSQVESQDISTISIRFKNETDSILTLQMNQILNILICHQLMQKFPYAELDFHSSDGVYRTLPKIDFWRVHALPVPEFVYDKTNYKFYNDTLLQGEIYDLKLQLQIYQGHQGDRLVVKYTITDENNNKKEKTIKYKRDSSV
ncbi:MAG: hypothetical protein R2766_03800 [Saprospiraceae bacterium]